MDGNVAISFLSAFEAKLYFDADIPEDARIGVAVSGGADSIALLTALSRRFPATRLRVITLNHNMRPEAETKGDADFVAAFCNTRGIPCTVVTLEAGLVHTIARERSRGEEEAARFLRYEAFDRFILQEKLWALCLAHNRNDQLETLVMRFLQGSDAVSGIAYRRGKCIRPLLYTSRADIERYLRLQGISWRTDATNADTAYLRNAVRHHVLPLLDAHFAGWQQAALSGAEKALDDSNALSALAAGFNWQACDSVADEAAHGCKRLATPDALAMPTSVFYAQPCAIRRRLLYRALTELRCEARFPYNSIRTVCHWTASSENAYIEVAGICLFIKNERLFVKKKQNRATEIGFLGILEREGSCAHCNGITYALGKNNTLLCTATVTAVPVCVVQPPILVRTAQSNDVIADSYGKMRSLSGIFSGWHIPKELRMKIPIVQELVTQGQPIIAVLGSTQGAKDWIVRERSL